MQLFRRRVGMCGRSTGGQGLRRRGETGWRYGRGLHPAGLNFGDCFTYALAKTTGEPLLFKGNYFSRTDLRLIFP